MKPGQIMPFTDKICYSHSKNPKQLSFLGFCGSEPLVETVTMNYFSVLGVK